MKVIINFNSLHKAVRKMGATKRDFYLESNLAPVDPIDTRLLEGIEVEIDDIETLSNGLLSYKGRQVLLYIQDHAWNFPKAMKDGAKGKKYHVTYCGTLELMHSRGRYDRYVAKNDISGTFKIDGYNENKEYISGETELNVCKNCLLHLKYNGYESHSVNWKIFNEFSLEEFFKEYASSFKQKPKYKEGERKSAYTEDWDEIIRGKKDKLMWRCEQCNADFSDHGQQLHGHHINGVKHDNSDSNLKVLCVDCHSKQPNHSHMKLSHEEKEIVRKLREELLLELSI